MQSDQKQETKYKRGGIKTCPACETMYVKTNFIVCPSDRTMLLSPPGMETIESLLWWELSKFFGRKHCPDCGTFFKDVALNACPGDDTKLEIFESRPGPTLEDGCELLSFVRYDQNSMEVYKAKRGNEIVHVKLLLWFDQTSNENFLKRSEPVIGLTHPNLMTLLSVQEVVESFTCRCICMVTDHANAISLEQSVQDSWLEEPLAAKIFADIANALQRTHELGIIHGAITSSNLFIDDAGTPEVKGLLAHFGVAERLFQKVQWEGVSTDMHTVNVYGDPNGMCPEFGRAQRPTPATDIYQLGCCLYRALCGKPPYTRETAPMVIMAHLMDEVDDIQEHNPKVSDAMKEIVYKCLKKDPAERYSSAAAVRDDLFAITERKSEADTTF